MIVYAIQVDDDNDGLELRSIVLTEEQAHQSFHDTAAGYGYSYNTATRYIKIEMWDAGTGEYIDDVQPVKLEGV